MIYEGKNPDTDKPIIKVFLNPLMNWIWIGVLIVVAGTLLALVPYDLTAERCGEVHMLARGREHRGARSDG